MKQFVLRNSPNLLAALGIGVAIYLSVSWAVMPVLQRSVGLFFVALVLHVWEEMRYPGGFAEMVTRRLNFALPNRYAAESIVRATFFISCLGRCSSRTSPGWQWRRCCWACSRPSLTSRR